ncbi:MAG TPA: hypothetical protein PLC74_13585 [Acetobacteraceae bacterium]|nr:hypothetical protein [Acetobacteraceae bacterium]
MAIQNPLNIPLGAALSAPITTSTGTQVKTGGGVLTGISVLVAGSAWTATFYDGTSTSGTELASIACDTVGPVSFPPMRFVTGLFVETAGTTAGSVKVASF